MASFETCRRKPGRTLIKNNTKINSRAINQGMELMIAGFCERRARCCRKLMPEDHNEDAANHLSSDTYPALTLPKSQQEKVYMRPFHATPLYAPEFFHHLKVL